MTEQSLFSGVRQAQLREIGLVPISRFSLSAAAFLSAFVSAALLWDKGRSLLGSYVRLARDIDMDLNSERMARLLEGLPTLFIFPLIICFSFVLLTGLLQTKFYFSPRQVALDMGRISPFSRLGLRGSPGRAVYAVLCSLCAVALATMLITSLSPGLLGLLNLDQQSYLAAVLQLGSRLGWTLFTGILLIGICAWFLERLSFTWKHRNNGIEDGRSVSSD